MKKYIGIKFTISCIILMAVCLAAGITGLGIAFGYSNNILYWIVCSIVSIILIYKGVSFGDKQAAIVFYKDSVTNNSIDHLSDNTPYWGWSVKVSDIIRVQYCNKEQLQEFFPFSRARAGILIELPEQELRYFAVGNFSKKQIEQIIFDLKNGRETL